MEKKQLSLEASASGIIQVYQQNLLQMQNERALLEAELENQVC